MIETKIEKLYRELLFDPCPESSEGQFEAACYRATMSGKKELGALLRLFYAETEPYFKWRLACVLTDMGRTAIAPELEKYLMVEDLDIQEKIAWCLVKLRNRAGALVIIEAALQTTTQRQYEWYLNRLQEQIDTEFSRKIARQIMSMSHMRGNSFAAS